MSADLEDDLLARMDGATSTTTTKTTTTDDDDYDGLDRRLFDPILGRPITKSGLDWIRSLSVPSSTSSRLADGGDEGERGEDEDRDSIVITIRPPTLIHPRLDELARGVADG